MGAHITKQQPPPGYVSIAVDLELTKRKHLETLKQLTDALDELEKARERIRNLEIILYDTPRD